MPADADELIDEVPVAVVCNGTTLAVMMATPAQLTDFVIGFCWTEGITTRLLRRDELAFFARVNGMECQISLDSRDETRLRGRMRQLVGSSSCGLCGVRSLAQAVPAPPSVGGENFQINAAQVVACVNDLRAIQPLHDRTRAAHAAAFFVPGRGMVAVREDIGRHNALDKLVGCLLRSGENPALGAVVLTSRVSVEMVQKVAAIGAPVIVAVSAPSALGVRVAKVAGITLIGSVRHRKFVAHTHQERICYSNHDELGATTRPDHEGVELHETR